MLSLLRRNRDFRRLFLAGAISLLGDWFSTVALLGYAIDLTHSPLVASMVFVAQELPGLLVGPWSGAIADRYDRKRVILLVTSLQAVAALSFLFVGPGHVWVIFAGAFAITTFASLAEPGLSAALPNVVDRDDFPTAAAMSGSIWGVMLVIGSGLGGVFIVLFGRRAAFIANAATFVVAVWLIGGIHRPMRQATAADTPAVPVRPLATLQAVWHFARANTGIPALMASRVGVGLAIGTVGLLAPLATQFHLADSGTAALLAARGAGAATGPIWARRVLARGGGTMFVACGAGAMLFGASYIGVAMAPAFLVAVICVGFAHVGAATQFNVATYGVMIQTPDEIRGRVAAVNEMLLTVATSTSFLVGGLLTGPLGTQGAIACLGGWVFAWGTIYIVVARRFKMGHNMPGTATPVSPDHVDLTVQ